MTGVGRKVLQTTVAVAKIQIQFFEVCGPCVHNGESCKAYGCSFSPQVIHCHKQVRDIAGVPGQPHNWNYHRNVVTLFVESEMEPEILLSLKLYPLVLHPVYIQKSINKSYHLFVFRLHAKLVSASFPIMRLLQSIYVVHYPSSTLHAVQPCIMFCNWHSVKNFIKFELTFSVLYRDVFRFHFAVTVFRGITCS